MRPLTAAFRNTLEAVHPDDAIVIFASVYHSSLAEPVRVNSDVVDYVWNGATYIRCAFQISFLTDDDSPPQAKVSIPNVDQRVGNAVRALTDSPRIEIAVLVKSDFNEDTPRRPIAVPIAEYEAGSLFLRNVSCTALALTADITSFEDRKS